MIIGPGLGFLFAAIARSTPATASDLPALGQPKLAAATQVGTTIKVTAGDFTLAPIVDIRERLESRQNNSFNGYPVDTDGLLSRIRLGFKFEYDKIKGQVLYQDGQFDGLTHGSSNHDSKNILLAYARMPVGDSTATFGRQRIEKGSQRVLGIDDWNDYSRSWDAVRFTGKKYDFFLAKLAVSQFESTEARLAGIATDSKYGLTLITAQTDKPFGTRYDLYTFDQYYKHRLFGMEFSLEGIGEEGVFGTQDVQAFAGIIKVKKAIGDRAAFTFGGAIASGGGGTHANNLFTNIYGSKQPNDGFAGVQGLSNLKEVSAALSLTWNKKIESSLTYYHFGLYDPTDGWYGPTNRLNSSGATTFIDPTGGAGTNVGQEIDLNTAWKVTKYANFSGGLATFAPGDFVKSFNVANDSKTQYFLYGQLNIKF